MNRFVKWLAKTVEKPLGFYDRLNALGLRISDLNDENRKLRTELDALHAAYMEKFREVEAKCAAPFNFREPIIDERRAREGEGSVSFVFMADREPSYREDGFARRAQHANVIIANYGFGFEFVMRSKDDAELMESRHAAAVGFARMASNMAYDYVMGKFGHRPKRPQNSGPMVVER